MDYKIEKKYCWYDKQSKIVLMYFINGIPFTFDELPDCVMKDEEIIKNANKESKWEIDDLYRMSYYLISEEAHPMLFDLHLVNPEELPID